jgi:hypothetical protein
MGRAKGSCDACKKIRVFHCIYPQINIKICHMCMGSQYVINEIRELLKKRKVIKCLDSSEDKEKYLMNFRK